MESIVKSVFLNGFQSGYIKVGGRTFFIEPLLDHVPNKRKQLIHVLHKPDKMDGKSTKSCGTSDNWEQSWRDAFWRKYTNKLEQSHNVSIRGMESIHRYLETLIVCDKKFLEYYKNTDYESYVLTIMNMVCIVVLDEPLISTVQEELLMNLFSRVRLVGDKLIVADFDISSQ